jgi:hypothetical protein
MESNQDNSKVKNQDLSKENLGNEPEEKAKGDVNSPYKLNDDRKTTV